MISGISLIVLSLVALPSTFIAKKTNAMELLDTFATYQGWIGMVFTFWGIYGIIINGLLGIELIANRPIYWVTLLAVNIMQTVLGFLLGYGMISKYVFSKNETAKISGEQLLARLAPIQGNMGMVGVGMGIWAIITATLF